MYWANKMIGESILDLHETNATDESIKSYEYDEYQPIAGTQLNSDGQITITIVNQDQFPHLHSSYLLIGSNVLKADDTRYADADLIALINNGLLYLFSNLKLTLAGQTVGHVNYPGQATSLLGLASYSTTFSNGCGLVQGWYPDTDFAKEQYAGVYKSFYDFASKYYGIDNLLAASGVSPPTFKSLYPIHVFDVSKQSERLTDVIPDVIVN